MISVFSITTGIIFVAFLCWLLANARSGILTDAAILRALRRGEIVISPFDRAALGGNSYDVHLSPYLRTYAEPGYVLTPPATGADAQPPWPGPLDCKRAHQTYDFEIPAAGFLLRPGILYLARTLEYTEAHRYIPILDGKSSMGRLGAWIHITAGYGDIGFCGGWTLEIVVVHPIIVYPGMPIGQLRFHSVRGRLLQPYNRKHTAKYTDAQDPRPQASRMHLNFATPSNPRDTE